MPDRPLPPIDQQRVLLGLPASLEACLDGCDGLDEVATMDLIQRMESAGLIRRRTTGGDASGDRGERVDLTDLGTRELRRVTRHLKGVPRA